jgi:hypothetical protein
LGKPSSLKPGAPGGARRLNPIPNHPLRPARNWNKELNETKAGIIVVRGGGPDWARKKQEFPYFCGAGTPGPPPPGAAVTKTGLVVVAGGVTGRLEIFNKCPCEFFGEWQPEDFKLGLASPPHFRGLARDSQNRLYITDIQNDCVIRLKLVEAEQPLIQINVTPVPSPTAVPTDTPPPDGSMPYGGQGFPIR